MPHSVITLKMIGMAFDYWDSTLAIKNKSEYQLANELKKPPELLEILGHTFIMSTYFFGPQTSLAKYRRTLVRNRRRWENYLLRRYI